MARKVPVSPAVQDAALDAALARAPRPALPPGLAARIVAQATAHPQLAPGPDGAGVPEPVDATAQVIPFAPAATASAAPAAAVSEPAPPRNRRLIFGAGFAALAASLVAVVVIGQGGQQPAMTPEMAKSGEIAVRSEVHLDAPKAHQAAPAPQLAAAAPAPKAAVRSTANAPVVPQVEPEAAPLVSPVAPQLATSGERPARDAVGPITDPSPGPRVVPNGGLMGPPAPQQGWAFTGGAPGSIVLPSGQSLPGQTTGTMPPPSGPGGPGPGGPGPGGGHP
ncbi:MAG: hypothetical protein NTX28_09630 [Novosphingobium sp.]|nr:hypothetical protein [Novosphingobium sp.]